MRTTDLKNVVLGIATTIMYPVAMMLAAYLICFLVSGLR